jgi:hypothetical protein
VRDWRWRWAELGKDGPSLDGELFFFLFFCFILYFISVFYFNSNPGLNFKFPKVQIHTNVNITSIVYNVFIYSSPC